MGAFSKTFSLGGLGSQGSKVNQIIPPAILTDTSKIAAWYNPRVVGGAVRNEAGVESIYWDMSVGNTLRSAEISSGVTVAFAVYEITATQTDYFFTGCQVGDIFPAIAGVALNASNKVKRVLGNHATQPFSTNYMPINGIFDGVNDYFKTATFTYNSPQFIYLLLKQISWNQYDYLLDGYVADKLVLNQQLPNPNVAMLGSSGVSPTLGEYHVIRMYYNEASSKLQLNDDVAVLTTTAAVAPGGLTIGGRGNSSDGGAVFAANYELIELIAAKSDEGESDIFNYLLKKKLIQV